MTKHQALARHFLALAFIAAIGCGDDDEAGTDRRVILAPEGNRLWAYALDDTSVRSQLVIPSADDAPGSGRDINGQICFAPGGRRFVSGDDTGQPDPPPGWGIFELDGERVGELSATQVGRLIPTFQGEPGEEGVPDSADPFGCAFLSDGRLLTTDIGNNQSGPANGQLIVWFPPLDAAGVRYCKLDVAIGTAGTIYVDNADRAYVASARVRPGVHRYNGPFPTSDDAAGGCGRADATGAPLADAVQRELFIAPDANVAITNGVAGTPAGTFFVSSVIGGIVAEYDGDGNFLRRVLEPLPGETIGSEPLTNGSPLGVASDSDGTLYYADLGLVVSADGIGPRSGAGSVRRVRSEDGVAQPPETIAGGLTFPDALGVLER
jgi:hypothetical protein